MTRFAASVALDPPAISALTQRVTDFLHEAGVDPRAVHHVALSLDELLTNAATHGGGAGLDAEVSLEVSADRVEVQILDSAAPYDPRGAAPAELEKPLDQREIGGLGLRLVMKLSHDLQYSRRDGRNLTRYWIRRQGSDDRVA